MTTTPFIKKIGRGGELDDVYDTRTKTAYNNPQEFFQAATEYFKRPVNSFEDGLIQELDDEDFSSRLKSPEPISSLTTMDRMLRAITRRAGTAGKEKSLTGIEEQVGDIGSLSTSALSRVVDLVKQGEALGGLKDTYQSAFNFLEEQQTTARQNLQFLLDNNALSNLDENSLITLGISAGFKEDQILALAESRKTNETLINSYKMAIENGTLDLNTFNGLGIADSIKSTVTNGLDWGKIPDNRAFEIIDDLMRQYTDAGISFDDDLKTAQQKIKSSAIYRKSVRISSDSAANRDKKLSPKDIDKYGIDITEGELGELLTQQYPPEWYRQKIENNLFMTPTFDELQRLWETDQGKARSATAETNKLVGETTPKETEMGILPTDTLEEKARKQKDFLDAGKQADLDDGLLQTQIANTIYEKFGKNKKKAKEYIKQKKEITNKGQTYSLTDEQVKAITDIIDDF